MPTAHLFPYEPNWGAGLKYRITYPCKVITSYEGVEQRILLKQIPILETEAKFDLGDGFSNGMFDALIWNGQSVGTMLPIWLYSTMLDEDILAGVNKVKIPTTNPYFGKGDTHIAFINLDNNNINEFATVTHTDDEYMYLLSPLTKNWQERVTFIVPCRPAKIPQEVQVIKFSSVVMSASIIFKYQETPLVPTLAPRRYYTVGDSSDAQLNDTTGIPLFHNEEICIMQGNRVDDTGIMFKRDFTDLDFNTGISTLLNKQWYSNVTRDFVMFLDGSDDIIDFIKWVDRRKGRCIPFWVNSGQNEIQLVNDAATGDTVIRVVDSNLEKLYEKSATGYANQIHSLKSNVIFFNKNGTSTYTRILTVGNRYPDGSVDLNVEALTGELKTDNVIIGSFLQHCRLDSDTVEIAFYDKDLASASLKFTETLYD